MDQEVFGLQERRSRVSKTTFDGKAPPELEFESESVGLGAELMLEALGGLGREVDSPNSLSLLSCGVNKRVRKSEKERSRLVWWNADCTSTLW